MENWVLNVVPTTQDSQTQPGHKQLAYFWLDNQNWQTKGTTPKMTVDGSSLAIFMWCDSSNNAFDINPGNVNRLDSLEDIVDLSRESTATLTVTNLGGGNDPFDLPNGVSFPNSENVPGHPTEPGGHHSFWWPGPGHSYQPLTNPNSDFHFRVTVVVTTPGQPPVTYTVDPEMVVKDT